MYFTSKPNLKSFRFATVNYHLTFFWPWRCKERSVWGKQKVFLSNDCLLYRKVPEYFFVRESKSHVAAFYSISQHLRCFEDVLMGCRHQNHSFYHRVFWVLMISLSQNENGNIIQEKSHPVSEILVRSENNNVKESWWKDLGVLSCRFNLRI